jgi:MFS family permease
MNSFTKKSVIGLFLISCFTFIMLYGSFLTYLPIHLYEAFNAPPYQIGIILSFASVSTAIMSTQLRLLVARFSYRWLLLIVNAVYILSMLTIPFIGELWWMLLPSGLFGVAQGVNIPAVQTLLAGSAPLQYRAAFMSANGMVLRLGQTLGPVIMGAVFAGYGMGATFYAGALVAVVMALIVSLTISGKADG